MRTRIAIKIFELKKKSCLHEFYCVQWRIFSDMIFDSFYHFFDLKNIYFFNAEIFYVLPLIVLIILFPINFFHKIFSIYLLRYPSWVI